MFQRDAVSRARFFLGLADQCTPEQRDEFEAFLEAAIVFARAALHRLQAKYQSRPKWKDWWDALRSDPSVDFFRQERNFILKEGPPKIGQVIRVGGGARVAADLYYFEDPDVRATRTVEQHLSAIERLVQDAHVRFS